MGLCFAVKSWRLEIESFEIWMSFSKTGTNNFTKYFQAFVSAERVELESGNQVSLGNAFQNKFSY